MLSVWAGDQSRLLPCLSRLLWQTAAAAYLVPGSWTCRWRFSVDLVQPQSQVMWVWGLRWGFLNMSARLLVTANLCVVSDCPWLGLSSLLQW